MGISLSLPFDPCVNKVSGYVDTRVGYIHHLEKNYNALKTAMEDLAAQRGRLSRRVREEERRGREILEEVKLWLGRVDKIEEKVNGLLRNGDAEFRRLCLCGLCSLSLISSYRYGKKVFFTLEEVEKLKRDGDFKDAVKQTQTPVVQEIQLPQVIVGQEKMLDKAWKQLTDEEVPIMGFWGMGGVGKTTLLTQLNNKLSGESLNFDFVIWIVVSQEFQAEKIQDEIAEKLGVKGKDKSQKANAIYNFLKGKKFVLFLDDIWAKVDLREIGVPFPTIENRCKVAFTTRSQDVCTRMSVEDPMEVHCLDEKEALELFRIKVGQRTLESDSEIPSLAKVVAKKCSGLPLALNVIGETMSSKRTTQEWCDAIDVLDSYATQFSGMKDKILPLLKYSYDNLKEEHSYDNRKGEQLQLCLLYCTLFPEDAKISKEKLIDYWHCEGFIDESESVEKTRNKGYELIGCLVRASLLMDQFNYVCMHDVVREMGLWIGSNFGIEKEAFIVRAGVGLKEMPNVEDWKVVRRMSLINNGIPHLAGRPKCCELTTLLMQDNNLKKVSRGFFKSMPKLAVLDLSENRDLSGSLELGSSLKYLNLAWTRIHHLPMGMNKLIHLDLEYTKELKSIAGISRLQSLKVLKTDCSDISWDHNTMEELGTLQHLETLTIDLKNDPLLLEQFLGYDRLASCTQFLNIEGMSQKSCGISLPAMNKLCVFYILNCYITKIKTTSFLSLSKVYIYRCNYLRELTFLMFVPNLQRLSVRHCDQVEDIVDKERARECEEESEIVPFPKLISLDMISLPKLKSIYWRPLRFPCLEEIMVRGCLNLKKLPFDSQSELILNYYEEGWIESVEWEDEATKTRFLSTCKLER